MKSFSLIFSAIYASIIPSIDSSQDGQARVRSSITPDEKAVYEAVLGHWSREQQARQLVSEELEPAPQMTADEVRECAKRLPIEFSFPDKVGAKSLSGVRFKMRGVQLIEPAQWKAHNPSGGIEGSAG